MGKHWFGVVKLEELLMAHSKSFVLLFPILLACMRLVSTYFLGSFAVPIHFEQGRSRENDECERMYDEEASNIIYVFMMRTRRNVERVLHSVFHWTVVLNYLFYKLRFQSRLTDNTAAFSHGWIIIWLVLGGIWSKPIFTGGYLFSVDCIACAVRRLRDEIISHYMLLKACCGKNERYRSSGCKSSRITAVYSRLAIAGCLCARFPQSSLAYNPGTSWRNGNAFAALLEDGTVQAWGDSSSGVITKPSGLANVRTIYSNKMAFAALLEDGTVQAWGDSRYLGSGVPNGLSGVRTIYSTNFAFAALLEDGTVQVWGNSYFGGSGLPSGLADVRTIYSTCCAFAALLEDDTVQTWGSSSYGGDDVPNGLSGVRTIYSTDRAFAALLEDGTVQEWGSTYLGGSGVPSGLANVRTIYSTCCAFAALLEDDTVQAWGSSDYGGSGMPSGLANVRTIYSTSRAFAALLENGTVQTWGSSSYGGDDVPNGLSGVRTIYSTDRAFAALLEDGTVQAWGSSVYGGSGVPSGLANVRTIYSTYGAFAALLEDDTVQVWGKSDYGGSGVPSGLANVRTIYSTSRAFAALLENGTVQAWGLSQYGGSGVPSDSTFIIFGSTYYSSLSNLPHKYDTFCDPGSAKSVIVPNGTSYHYTMCTTCQRGSFDNQAYCVPCSAGKYSLDSSATSCDICSVGRFSESGSAACFDCEAGKYAPKSGSRVCSPCDGGKYSPVANAISCDICSVGRFSESGSTACFDCEAGKYAPKSGSRVCSLCDEGKSSVANSSSCFDCSVNEYAPNAGISTCLACNYGDFSFGGANACIGNCGVGYMYSMTKLICVKCVYDEACKNGITCEEGYEGSGCASCSFGWFLLNDECRECPDIHPAILITVGIVFTIVFGVMAYFVTKKMINFAGASTIAISHFQSLEMVFNLNIPIPSLFYTIANWITSIFSFLFVKLFFSPECSVPYSFYERWSIMTFIPCIFLVVFALFSCVDPSHGMAILNLAMSILYMYLLRQGWLIWDCMELEDGSHVMEVAPDIVCFQADSWAGFAFLSLVFILCSSLFPLVILRELRDAQNSRDDADMKSRLGFLYLKYKDDFYWWEPAVEMPKKWLIVFWATFMPTGETQAAMEIVTLCLFWGLHARYAPFKDDWRDSQGHLIASSQMQNLENKLQHWMYAAEILMILDMLIFFELADDVGDVGLAFLFIIYFTAILIIGYHMFRIWERQSVRDNQVGAENEKDFMSQTMEMLPEGIAELYEFLVKWSVRKKDDVDQDLENATEGSLELKDLYKVPADGEDGEVPSFHNPIYSNALETVKKNAKVATNLNARVDKLETTEIDEQHGTLSGLSVNGAAPSVVFGDGSEYIGDMRGKLRHGTGVMKYKNGDRYDGEWRGDKRHGRGTMTFRRSGNTYDGDWKDDLKHGEGVFTFANGACYEGAFVDDLKHGKGRMTTPKGKCIEGTWVNNKRERAAMTETNIDDHIPSQDKSEAERRDNT